MRVMCMMRFSSRVGMNRRRRIIKKVNAVTPVKKQSDTKHYYGLPCYQTTYLSSSSSSHSILLFSILLCAMLFCYTAMLLYCNSLFSIQSSELKIHSSGSASTASCATSTVLATSVWVLVSHVSLSALSTRPALPTAST